MIEADAATLAALQRLHARACELMQAAEAREEAATAAHAIASTAANAAAMNAAAADRLRMRESVNCYGWNIARLKRGSPDSP